MSGAPIGRSNHRDVAIAPRLLGDPFDRVVAVHVVGKESRIAGNPVRIRPFADALRNERVAGLVEQVGDGDLFRPNGPIG